MSVTVLNVPRTVVELQWTVEVVGAGSRRTRSFVDVYAGLEVGISVGTSDE